MKKTALIICILLISMELYSKIVRKLDESKNKYYLFDVYKNKAITKAEFDMIYCKAEDVSGALMIKGDKYGIYYFADDKLEIVSMSKNKIKWLYNNVFLVEKKGKYAVLEAKQNIFYNPNDKKTRLQKSAPIFISDFVFLDAIATDSVYHYSEKTLAPLAPLVLLKMTDKWIALNLAQNKVGVKEKPILYEIVRPVLINKRPNYIVKLNGKYGVADNQGYLNHEIVYDTAFPVVGCQYTESGKSIGCYDEFVLKKGTKHTLMNVFRKLVINPNEIQLVDGKPTYEYGKLSKYFLNNPEIEIIERLTVGDYSGQVFVPSNMLIIKKNGKVGLANLKKILIEPIHQSYNLMKCDYQEKETTHIKFISENGEYLYQLIKLLYDQQELIQEPYVSCNCSYGTITVKKSDSKWYFHKSMSSKNNNIAYDRISSSYYSGTVGYIGNKVHQYYGSTYIELEIPAGAVYLDYNRQLNGFTYRLNSKVGFKSPSKNLDPIFPSLNFYQDDNEKIFFETTINNTKYSFYLTDIISPTEVYSRNKCSECQGLGYYYTEKTTTRIEKGKTTTHTKQTHLWRDTPTYTTTTTTEPDKEIKETQSTKHNCLKCSGTKLQKIKLVSLNGDIQITDKF